MFSFLNKINIPKKVLIALVILVIALIILYVTGAFKKIFPKYFEKFSNSDKTDISTGLDDFTDTLNLKI